MMRGRKARVEHDEPRPTRAAMEPSRTASGADEMLEGPAERKRLLLRPAGAVGEGWGRTRAVRGPRSKPPSPAGKRSDKTSGETKDEQRRNGVSGFTERRDAPFAVLVTGTRLGYNEGVARGCS